MKKILFIIVLLFLLVFDYAEAHSTCECEVQVNNGKKKILYVTFALGIELQEGGYIGLENLEKVYAVIWQSRTGTVINSGSAITVYPPSRIVILTNQRKPSNYIGNNLHRSQISKYIAGRDEKGNTFKITILSDVIKDDPFYIKMKTVNLYPSSSYMEVKLINVIDGDTITVMDSKNETLKIRIIDIDCPEISQPFGIEAKNFTTSKLTYSDVKISIKGKDKYYRTLAEVYYGDISIAEELAKEGLAWSYNTSNQKVLQYEKEAKAAMKNIWSVYNPEPPWEYRKRTKQE
jgi:endonuclease YncB( thermonuclease family)